MSKLKLIVITLFVLFLGVSFNADKVNAANVSFNITANSGSSSPGQGNFSPSSITVNQNDVVTITFSVPSNDPYCCGLEVKGNGGQFDTGVISPGGSAQVQFTASTSFGFTSYWPSTGTVKAIGTVNVTAAPSPPSPPSNVTAVAVSTTQVSVSWNSAMGATTYEIYRNDSLVQTWGGTSWTNSGLSPNTSYNYKLKACNAAGCSAFSTTVLVTTQQQVVSSSSSSSVSTSSQSSSASTTSTTSTTSTSSASNSSTSNTSTSSSSSSQGAEGNVFTDNRYDYVLVKDKIYGFTEIPTVKIGEKFEIFGRTEALADVLVVVNSDPKEYKTKADENGYWKIDVSTTELVAGAHSFQTTVTSNGKTKSFDTVAFNVQIAQLANTGNTSTSSSSSSAPKSSNKILSMALIFIVPVILIAIAVIYVMRMNKNSKEDLNPGFQKPENSSFPPVEPMNSPKANNDSPKAKNDSPEASKEEAVQNTANTSKDKEIKSANEIKNETEDTKITDENTDVQTDDTAINKDVASLNENKIEEGNSENLIDKMAQEVESTGTVTPVAEAVPENKVPETLPSDTADHDDLVSELTRPEVSKEDIKPETNTGPKELSKEPDVPEAQKEEKEKAADAAAEVEEKPAEVEPISEKPAKPDLPELVERPNAPKVHEIINNQKKHPFMMPTVSLENKIPGQMTPNDDSPHDPGPGPMPSSI